MSSVLLFFLLAAFARGDQVIQFQLKTEDQAKALLKLQEDTELDVWRLPRVGIIGEVAVSHNTTQLLIPLLNQWGISHEVVIKDLNKFVQSQMKENEDETLRLRRRNIHLRGVRATSVVGIFARYSDINAWLDALADAYSFASVRSIGSSYEGRSMKVLKLSTGSNRRAIVMDSAIHAREWLAPATLIYVIDKLIKDFSKCDSTARSLLKRFDFYFIPIANPDGYEYSFLSPRNRLWRKTRQPHSRKCAGADINRNFDSHFRLVGTSTNPCSEVYGGPRAWSEPETLNLRNFFKSLGRKFVLYMTLHTYSQMWLTPWGYKRKLPADYSELMRVANIGNKALYKVNRVRFQVGSAARLLYESSGDAADWVKEKLEVRYAYTMELRPDQSSRKGFVVPTSTIRPSGEEMYAGLVAAANALPTSCRK